MPQTSLNNVLVNHHYFSPPLGDIFAYFFPSTEQAPQMLSKTSHNNGSRDVLDANEATTLDITLPPGDLSVRSHERCRPSLQGSFFVVRGIDLYRGPNVS